MTDPKQLAQQFEELAEGNREKAEEEVVMEREEQLKGAANAYQDAANHLREELVRMDTITVPVVDFAFFQAQTAHALERAMVRDEEEGEDDLSVESVRRAHEQMLSILETHADRPTLTLELPDEEMLNEKDIHDAMESMAEAIKQGEEE
jgi:hypothetical protein